MRNGNIYLIHEREFVRLGENVYKIGRTDDVKRRLSQYPKGSRLLFSVYTCDCLTAERDLIRRFKSTFKHREDIGREYFEGDYHDMINIIIDYVTNQQPIVDDDDSNDDDDDSKDIKQDLTMVIMEYVELHSENLAGKHVRSRMLFQGFVNWLKERRYNVPITHLKFVREMKRLYGAKDFTHHFDDDYGVGVEHCVSFSYFLARPTPYVTEPDPIPHVPRPPTNKPRAEFESLLRRCRYVKT
jgi:hypothetical protein